MGTTSTTPAAFNGTSTYAAQLQQEITQAVNIASLPLNQLNANLSTLQKQKSELTTLQGDFGSILTSIQSLDQANNGGGLSASVSDNSVATATLDSSSAISGGTYNLDVIDAGAPTTTVSNSGLTVVADPSTTSISSSSSFTLSVGTSTFTITPSANNLDALAQAINTSGAGANATIVNIGSPSAPDYRLSLQSTALGDVDIQLNDGTQNLLTTSTTGTPAQYQINGQPVPPAPISSDSRHNNLGAGSYRQPARAGQYHDHRGVGPLGRCQRTYFFRNRLQSGNYRPGQKLWDRRRSPHRPEHRLGAAAIASGPSRLLGRERKCPTFDGSRTYL